MHRPQKELRAWLKSAPSGPDWQSTAPGGGLQCGMHLNEQLRSHHWLPSLIPRSALWRTRATWTQPSSCTATCLAEHAPLGPEYPNQHRHCIRQKKQDQSFPFNPSLSMLTDAFHGSNGSQVQECRRVIFASPQQNRTGCAYSLAFDTSHWHSAGGRWPVQSFGVKEWI